MKPKSIKSDWGTVCFTEENHVIICIQKEEPECLWFSSPESFNEALSARQLVVEKWAITIPEELCIIKHIDLPASTMDEAIKMLEFELPTLVPLATDQLVYGCFEGKTDDNTISLTVFILKRDFLDQRLEPLHNINIKPEKIIIDSLALERYSTVMGAANPQCKPFAPSMSEASSQAYDFESRVALGLWHLVTANEHQYANLIPAGYLRTQQNKQRYYNYGLSAALFVLLLVCLWCALYGMNWRITTISKQITSQISPYTKIAEDISSKRSLITVVKQIDKRRHNLSSLFEALDKHTQDTTITISSLTYEVHPAECLLNLTGQVTDIMQLSELSDRTRNSPLLGGINLAHIGSQSTSTADNDRVEFKLKCSIKD